MKRAQPVQENQSGAKDALSKQRKYTAPAPATHEDAIYAAALGTFGARKQRRIAAAMLRWESRKGRGRK